MKKIIRYRFFYSAITVLLLTLYACNTNSTAKGKLKIPRLNPKYGIKDTEPMGARIAHQYVGTLFDHGLTDMPSKSFTSQQYDISHDGSVYIILSRMIFFSNSDVDAFMRYAANGNTVFISADYIDRRLLDTLGVDMDTDFSGFFFSPDEYDLPKETTGISLIDPAVQKGKNYEFFYLPFAGYFSEYDSASTQRLGKNNKNGLNCIAVNYGRGKFIFHAAPAAFSNHFLLKEGNYEYVEKLFSYINPAAQQVYWDTYYRKMQRDRERFSILGFLKKYPPLYHALLLVLFLLLLYIAFSGKRRQRYVPERIPKTNTTVSFTETIGRLYLQKKDNRNIALKMITYFMEYVRTHYFLSGKQLNREFTEALSRKSGVSEARVAQLLQQVEDINQSEQVSDLHLLDLHNRIQEFIKK